MNDGVLYCKPSVNSFFKGCVVATIQGGNQDKIAVLGIL